MPATLRYLDTDMVTVYETGDDGKKKRLATLLWGDQVKVLGKSQGFWKLDFTTRVWDNTKKKYIWKKHDAFIDGDVVFRDDPLLKVRFVDVERRVSGKPDALRAAGHSWHRASPARAMARSSNRPMARS